MVVLQNMFSSLFNSHLFDFHEGWMYVLGVGIAGGMVLRARSRGDELPEQSGAMIAGMHAEIRYQRPRTRLESPSLSAAGQRNDASFATDPRNLLIAAHDALATALALLASFYLRFEGGEAFYRPPAAAAAHSAVLRRLQRRDLLRLQPDDDEMAFHFAAGCAEHHARGDRAGGRADRAGLCLRFQGTRRQSTPLLFGQITIVLYWFLQVFVLSALALSPIVISAIRACAIMPGPKERRRRC